MIVAGQRFPILIATQPVDFRCGHQALALLAQTELKLDPHLLEKALQTAVGRRYFGASWSLRRDMGQVHGAGANHPKHQQAQRLNPGLAELKMWG